MPQTHTAVTSIQSELRKLARADYNEQVEGMTKTVFRADCTVDEIESFLTPKTCAEKLVGDAYEVLIEGLYEKTHDFHRVISTMISTEPQDHWTCCCLDNYSFFKGAIRGTSNRDIVHILTGLLCAAITGPVQGRGICFSMACEITQALDENAFGTAKPMCMLMKLAFLDRSDVQPSIIREHEQVLYSVKQLGRLLLD